MVKLGVNIDHVATVRQARRAPEPDPVRAAVLAELGGADGITIHLREDRRHIQDRDVELLRATVTTRLNLEMGLAAEIIKIALSQKPDQVTFVPEKRQELTTEGGLDVVKGRRKIRPAVARFKRAGIIVSLFIDPDDKQIEASKLVGADAVEIHTGAYAGAPPGSRQTVELDNFRRAVAMGLNAGLVVNAGHGLTYTNVGPIAGTPGVHELNIGHSIVSRAVFVGIERAVAEMKRLMNPAGA
jgi:pyridoxine 5-phosphate synthase